MERTTVDSCFLVDGTLDLGVNIFSLEELVIGTQTDSQTSTSFAPSKTVFLHMSCKPEDNELAKEENKQSLILVEREGGTASKSGCTGIIFFFWGNYGLGCPAHFFCFCLACFFLFSAAGKTR